MTVRCPHCGNADVTVRKYTLPSPGGGNVTVYDYYCPMCDVLETINADEPGWDEALKRWRQQASADPVESPMHRSHP